MRINPEDLEAEADAAFAAANGAPTEESADTELNAASTEVEAQPIEVQDSAPAAQQQVDTATAEPEHDSDSDLTTAQALERYRNAQSRMTRATQEAAELRRAQQAQASELAQLRAELAAARSAPPRQADTAPAAGSNLDSVEAEYPDFSPVVAQIKAQEQQLRELRESNAVSARQAAYEAHLKAVTAVHPDAIALANSDQFSGWVDRQPPAIQQIISNGTAADVNWVLSQYKTAAGVTKTQSKDDKLAAAKLAASPNLPRVAGNAAQTGKRTFTRDQIAKMSPAQFAKHEAEIDAAMASGLIY